MFRNLIFAAVGSALTTQVTVANADGGAQPVRPDVVPVHVRHLTSDVGGVRIFYREAGSADSPVILLLHGFPSSSRQFDTLIPRLATRYHVIAPDYPGFGHSDAPPADRFEYTFKHLADLIDAFVAGLGIDRYTMYLNDYGGPIGYRIAAAHPERVQALIVQNAVAHEEGLNPALWGPRRAFWADRTANESKLRANLASLEATRLRHIGSSPHPERYSPDLWTDEIAFLGRSGQEQIQIDLFYDYRTNLESYSTWQAYLRKHQPPMLVVWGRYDPSFTVAETDALKRDVPGARVHIVDGGHFALDEAVDEAAALILEFLPEHTRKR